MLFVFLLLKLLAYLQNSSGCHLFQIVLDVVEVDLLRPNSGLNFSQQNFGVLDLAEDLMLLVAGSQVPPEEVRGAFLDCLLKHLC